jgi:hypothetical protein
MNKQRVGGASIRALKVWDLKENLKGGIVAIDKLNSGLVSSSVGVSRRSMSRRGIIMSVKGRLNGVRRARGMREMEGGVSGNSLCKKHKSSSSEISTKWGIWQLKVSLN